MLLSTNYFSCLCPDHQLPSIIRNHYISLYKIYACANDTIFLLNTRHIDELIANQLPLLDTLNSTSNKLIMTARSKTNVLYLPSLLMSICHYCHYLLIEQVYHHQLTNRICSYTVYYQSFIILGKRYIKNVNNFFQIKAF